MQTSWEKVDNPDKYWIFFGLWVLVLVAKKTSWKKEIRDSCGKLFVIWWYIISVPLATQSVLYMHMIHPLDYHKQYRYTGTPQEMRLTQNYTESIQIGVTGPGMSSRHWFVLKPQAKIQVVCKTSVSFWLVLFTWSLFILATKLITNQLHSDELHFAIYLITLWNWWTIKFQKRKKQFSNFSYLSFGRA